MNVWIVGIDLGATKIDFGLVSPQEQIVARQRILTNQQEGPQAIVERIAQTIAELEKDLPQGDHIAAVGICTPGPVDFQAGMLLDPPNIQALHYTPLRQMLSERLNLPVCLEHDAKAAAVGEFYYGAGRGEQSMVYIVVGTGVGAAFIIDRQVYHGLHSLAGEVGHITLNRNGELCSCGSRGCVETYMSGPWLARRYQHAIHQEGWMSSVEKNQQTLTGEQVAHLAKQGDPLAVKILVEAGEALGIAIASLAMILNIDLYVIGGSVAKAGDLFLQPARKIVPHYSFKSVSQHVRIVATELDTDGPILGCSWLARQIKG
jgi:glucokinase